MKPVYREVIMKTIFVYSFTLLFSYELYGENTTTLYQAAREGDIEKVRELIMNEYDVCLAVVAGNSLPDN